MSWRIPLFDLHFDAADIRAVTEVLESGWLTTGELTQQFEREFAAFVGARHAVAVSNCTAALHLANQVLGVEAGAEVICPSLTFVATANSIRYEGAKPVFADVTSLDDWNVGVAEVDRVRTARTRAILVVHYAGYPADMAGLRAYADAHGLGLIEDAAHAPGAAIDGRGVGAWGDVGCFSFFSNKNLSTGEGGMVTVNDDELAARLRLLRSHGTTSMTLDRHRGHGFTYDVVVTGYNYRITEITAALGLCGLRKLEEANGRRALVAARYRQELARVPGIRVPFADAPGEAAYHIFPILLDKGIERERVMERLKVAGIQTSVHYRPIHTFSSYRSEYATVRLPNTDTIGAATITLPLYPRMTEQDATEVVAALEAAVRQ